MVEVVKPLDNEMWFSLDQWNAMKELEDRQAFKAGLENFSVEWSFVNHKRVKRQYNDRRNKNPKS
jgi:hypothetical protein